ncbi:TetR/AcrR family transcriptional regulator [bacterium]|nr:TetR/AcrR family transcriptional regulator [bacterium]
MPRLENSAQTIIEKVAPVFNQKGYEGTSLSDLTRATGMTKGALYCNFKNKQAIAIASFRHNVHLAIDPLSDKLKKLEDSQDQLFEIVNYYRNYHETSKRTGGCPIVSVGVDSRSMNPELHEEVLRVSGKLIKGIESILTRGIRQGVFNSDIDPPSEAHTVYSMIQGGIFMTMINNDSSFLDHVLDHLQEHITQNILK